MESDHDNKDIEVNKELYIEGHVLVISAVFEGESGWSLAIQNEKGIATHWHDYFSSADDAINVGLKAINEEGVDEFMGYDYFGYMYEE